LKKGGGRRGVGQDNGREDKGQEEAEEGGGGWGRSGRGKKSLLPENQQHQPTGKPMLKTKYVDVIVLLRCAIVSTGQKNRE